MGLTLAPHRIEFRAEPMAEPGLLTVDEDSHPVRGWTVRRLTSMTGHIAAVAVQHSRPTLTCVDGTR